MRLFQVDAFCERLFAGNPAAVVVPTLEQSQRLTDDLMLRIAEENNLSETAFVTARAAGDETLAYDLRWFTPAAEVDLCGHATMATAHVLFEHLRVTEQAPHASADAGGDANASKNAEAGDAVNKAQKQSLHFHTRSGLLTVERQADGQLVMDFPLSTLQSTETPADLIRGIGGQPSETVKDFDYIAVLENEQAVRDLQPDFTALSKLDGRGVLVTAPGDKCDFVSRCFFPKLKVNEDPVTGSAHCELAAYWAHRLGKNELQAQQLSARGGVVECVVKGERVLLKGRAVTYLRGEMLLGL